MLLTIVIVVVKVEQMVFIDLMEGGSLGEHHSAKTAMPGAPARSAAKMYSNTSRSLSAAAVAEVVETGVKARLGFFGL